MEQECSQHVLSIFRTIHWICLKRLSLALVRHECKRGEMTRDGKFMLHGRGAINGEIHARAALYLWHSFSRIKEVVRELVWHLHYLSDWWVPLSRTLADCAYVTPSWNYTGAAVASLNHFAYTSDLYVSPTQWVCYLKSYCHFNPQCRTDLAQTHLAKPFICVQSKIIASSLQIKPPI